MRLVTYQMTTITLAASRSVWDGGIIRYIRGTIKMNEYYSDVVSAAHPSAFVNRGLFDSTTSNS